MSIEADARHQLKMPQYGADKDSLIGNTSDNGSADNVEDVDDGEEDITKNVQQKSVYLEPGNFPMQLVFSPPKKRVKPLQADQLWPSSGFH